MNPIRISQETPWQPITLPQAKHQVRLGAGVVDHDDELNRLIQAATETVENDNSIVFAAGEFRFTLDAFPAGPIRLPWRNATAVSKVIYIDSAGNSQTLSDPDIQLSTSKGFPRVYLASGEAWPNERNQPDSVAVEFQAGYSSPAEVPGNLHRQCLAVIGILWEKDAEVEDFGPHYRALAARNVSGYLN